MAKKKEIGEELLRLKEKVQQGKAVIGAERVLKGIRSKKLVEVFVSRNCPQKIREDILLYSDLVGIPVTGLELDNEELGILCKKNFFVSVLGIAGE